MKKKPIELNAWKRVLKMKNPDQMFDMCIWGIYYAGIFKSNMPIEEARAVFQKIKKLIK